MEKEIRIKEFFIGLKKRLWLILLITTFGVIAGGLFNIHLAKSAKPMYQSATTFLVPVNKPEYLQAFTVILKDPTILDKVNEKLQLNRTEDMLNRQISGTLDTGSMMKITVTDPNPEIAANIANTTRAIFLQQIGTMFGVYDVKIIAEAKPDKNPIATSTKNYLVLGIGIGIILSVGIVLLLESLDDTVQTVNGVEKLLALPVLGSVSMMNKKNTSSGSKMNGSSKRGVGKGGSWDAGKKETYTN